MGCGVSTTTNPTESGEGGVGGTTTITPAAIGHQAPSSPRSASGDHQSNEAPPSEHTTSLKEACDATLDSNMASEDMGSSLPPFPAKVSKYKRQLPGTLDGVASTYDEDATTPEEVPSSGIQNSSTNGLSTVLNGSHPGMGGGGGCVATMGPFPPSHCEDTSSTGPNTPMSMSSSHRSCRRRAKRTSCDVRPMQFKSVLDGNCVAGGDSSPSSNPLGKTSQSGDISTRSRANTLDAEDSDAAAFAASSGVGGGSALMGGKRQSSSFTTNPSSPSNAHPPTDNFSPHSPFFTGNSSNSNQRAPKGWEKVNMVRNGSVESSLETSGILGSSMKSSVNHRGRPAVCGGTKSLPSIDQSPHSHTLVPTTTVASGSGTALPQIQHQRKRGASTSVVVNPNVTGGGRRRSSRTRHSGGRLPMTLMSSSSGSLESLLLSDTELQHGVDEVFASSTHFVPAVAQPVPTPGGSPMVSPSLMRSTTSNGTTVDEHQTMDVAMSTPPPPPRMKNTNDTTAFGAKSETQFPREMSEDPIRRSSFPAVVSPGLPPVAPLPSSSNHPPPRGFRLPSTDATNMFYGNGKRMSESSGTTTVNNHSLALTDVSIGRGGWGMSSSTTSVSQIKESPQMF